MAKPVVMPKQGNTVESCLLLRWFKSPGDQLAEGERLCEVETDKAIMEVPSPAGGILLETFFNPGDEIPVLTHIAVIGEPGEDPEAYRTERLEAKGASGTGEPGVAESPTAPAERPVSPPDGAHAAYATGRISPRASRLAMERGVNPWHLKGSGPGGRVIERDILAAPAPPQTLSPVARSMVEKGPFVVPAQGSGLRGWVMSRDLIPKTSAKGAHESLQADEEITRVPLKGVRRLIAERMLESVQTSAQLTLNTSADAQALLAYRERLKASPEEWGLQDATINDLVLYVVSRTLLRHPELNATFENGTIYQYRRVHLGFAVDTARGLVVPVIRDAASLRLRELVMETRRLTAGASDGKISPDELHGGTFTISNLGSLGIESFTPILNPPQVAIMGVGTIQLKPVDRGGEVKYLPHLGLSLTINHQVVDGAPGARFLGDLKRAITEVDLMIAM